MFKSKWDRWYDSLPANTKVWLKNQPLWHDIDLAKAFLVGVIIGLVLAMIF